MKRFVTVIITLSMLVLSISVVLADIDDKKEELEKVETQIKNKEEELDSVEAEIKKTKNQIAIIEVELKNKEEELNKTTFELEQTQQQLKKTRNELEEAIEQEQRHEELMAKRVRAMYMNSDFSYLETILESKSINDMLDTINAVKKIIEADTGLYLELKEYREEINKKKKKLELEEQQIVKLKEDLENQKVQIMKRKADRDALLDKLEEQRLLCEEEIDELEKTSKELEGVIQKLLEEQKKKEDQQRQQQQYNGGSLVWPVPGYYRITSPFGNRVHPVTGKVKFHSGIDIGSRYVNGVRESIYRRNFVAAEAGTVIMARYYGGYGNCVIIDHGGGLTTLCGHGDQILVSVGQRVNRGQPVLLVGTTGVSTGPHAHFEVRINGVAVNPMNYLN